jgi:hypothetical protein
VAGHDDDPLAGGQGDAANSPFEVCSRDSARLTAHITVNPTIDPHDPSSAGFAAEC